MEEGGKKDTGLAISRMRVGGHYKCMRQLWEAGGDFRGKLGLLLYNLWTYVHQFRQRLGGQDHSSLLYTTAFPNCSGNRPSAHCNGCPLFYFRDDTDDAATRSTWENLYFLRNSYLFLNSENAMYVATVNVF